MRVLLPLLLSEASEEDAPEVIANCFRSRDTCCRNFFGNLAVGLDGLGGFDGDSRLVGDVPAVRNALVLFINV